MVIRSKIKDLLTQIDAEYPTDEPIGSDEAAAALTLSTLLHLQLIKGHYDGAASTQRLLSPLRTPGQPELQATFLYHSALLLRLQGQPAYEVLASALAYYEAAGDLTSILRCLLMLADLASRSGQHADAQAQLDTASQRFQLATASQRFQLATPTLQLVRGMLLRRQGQALDATHLFDDAHAQAQQRGDAVTAVRAALQQALIAHAQHDFQRVRTLLTPALEQASTFGLPGGPLELRLDLDELTPLWDFARHDPTMSDALARFLQVGIAQPTQHTPTVHLDALVLGPPMLFKDGQLIPFTLRDTVAVLLYITLHPGRQRTDIQSTLFPDRPAQAASNYTRKALAELADKLGPVIEKHGPHNAPTYHLAPHVQLTTDIHALHIRLHQGDLRGAQALIRDRDPSQRRLPDNSYLQHMRAAAFADLKRAQQTAQKL
ncbi:hypothetical protein [Deinococcus ruber]|uniref:Uncharacterized protein n=1 Tax=Deinococcus ruber TaxID=1848197 RepID=A0A918CE94_9DEIO|nr:hypothetical protein [Deinococcus ruber]GGR18238.1 hypothetical protein GCM10008957_33760 [Deinococcus ruber]